MTRPDPTILAETIAATSARRLALALMLAALTANTQTGARDVRS